MIKRFTRHACFHYSICLLLVSIICVRAGAQTFPEPEKEQLLNGLKVLFWNRPGDSNVLLRLRLNSGAAFDLAGKNGTMALLGDVLFPDPATREYVTEQLGGQLVVTTNYDGIDVLISGKASDFERMVELLRGAVVTTQLTPENIARVREARIKKLSHKASSATEIADRAIAARLFGNFPYGRSAEGSVESLSKIERADLMLARERFLNADNATLVVIGGVEKLRAMRTLRQLIGSWQKGDRTVPATFRQPSPPDVRVLVLNQHDASSAEIRLAVRGFARSDRDAAAATLLAQIVRARWQIAVPSLSAAFVSHEAHALPGSFVVGGSTPNASAPKAMAAAQNILQALAQTGPTVAELENARAALIADINRRASQPETTAETWLDIDIYKLASANAQASAVSSLTVADLQRVAGRLFKEAFVVRVVVGDAEQLKTGLGSGVELQNDKALIKTAIDPVVPTKKP
jgi:zinc protease